MILEVLRSGNSDTGNEDSSMSQRAIVSSGGSKFVSGYSGNEKERHNWAQKRVVYLEGDRAGLKHERKCLRYEVGHGKF